MSLDIDRDNVLNLKYETKSRAEDEGTAEGGWRYHRSERSSGLVTRALKLPDNIDASGINARVENGVLKVVVPKLAAQASTSRKISVA